MATRYAAPVPVEHVERPASPEWETIRSAPKSRPVLMLTRALGGSFDTPFVGRWSKSEECWVNASEVIAQPVYPEFWCKIPSIEKD